MRHFLWTPLLFVTTVAVALGLTPDILGRGTLAAILVVAAVLIVVERIRPGAPAPAVRHWYPRAILLNFCQILTVVAAGLTWNRWLAGRSIFHAASWNFATAVVATYALSTFVFYWWHRYRHESAFWWRFAHQIHHSVSRLEALSAFYKHPLEMVIDSLLGSLLLYPVMGCSPAQGGAYTLAIALPALFYHWNVRTPRLLGHWIQRPESHRIHHAKRRHTKNYADLPVWDKLFGTFSNPSRADTVECGFGPGKETRLGDLLAGVPVEMERESEPIGFNPACFGCRKRFRCRASAPDRH